MAAVLPDGATVFIASAYSAEKAVTAITNAKSPVVTATAHGFSNGDFVEVTSGWGALNGRIMKISGVNTDTFKLEGIDTSNTDKFPAGAGLGSVRKVNAWTQITQILSFETSGGDQQFVTYSFLEEDFERQLPSITSAQSINIGIADDPTLPGYKATKEASDVRANTGLRLNLRSGSVIVYNSVVSLNETPTLTKGQVMQVQATFALQGRPTRY